MEESSLLMYLIFLWNGLAEGLDNLSILEEYQGSASQSSSYNNQPWSADKAVDGHLEEDRGLSTCSITWANYKVKEAWWKLSLKRMSYVAYLEIYFRSSTVNRHVGFSVLLFNGPLYRPSLDPSQHTVFTQDPSTCLERVTNITINKVTQGIALYNSKNRPASTTCEGYEPTFATIEICEVKVMGCKAQHYGENCTPCDLKCRDRQCDAFDGSCIDGCSETVIESPDCSECIDGYHGKECTHRCGFCKHGTYCDKTSGICPLGCQRNWNPPMCDECIDGYYGTDCTHICGFCKIGTHCNKTSGICHDGCQDNWTHSKCIVCKNGFYGQSCEFNCGKCRNGTFCDNRTGICPEGCQDHWNGSFCDACIHGLYGQTCENACGNCRNGTFCNRTSGVCPDGCEDHWDGQTCQECKSGFYGPACEDPCEKCKNETYCNKMNGTCPDGCQSHWNGSKCDVCEDGFYGTNCSQECKNCIGNICMKDIGNCSYGCKGGWTGARCDALSPTSEPNTGGIVGGLITVFTVMVFVVLIVIAVLRRQQMIKEQGDTANLFSSVKYDPQCNNEEKGYVNIGGKPSDESTDTGLPKSFSSGEYYNINQVSTVIHIQELQDIITAKSSEKQRLFRLEYNRLPPADVNKCMTAQKKENITKNRFKTTFPYEHSRVVLEKWDDHDNDYINANYIKDYKGDRRYIAAQGPSKNTLADFMKMVWQENIEYIIMLTNLVENGKNKCAMYWADQENPRTIGPYILSSLEETTYAFYTFRKFSLQRKNTHDLRIITQFHYTAWPDHDTPEEMELVQFHRAVMKRYVPRAPLLVHCSAGVGRTGAFIGLDSLLQHGRETGRIDVFDFVKQMREDRMSMVQTLEQYVFLHKALLCGFQERETIISESELETIVNSLLHDVSPLNQQQLYREFKFLDTIIPVYEDKCKEDALTPENRLKHVDMNILPVSKYRPYLTSHVKGRNDYINAVIIPTFNDPAGLFLTQKPLPDTEVDLWRLCMDHQVGAIVVLNDSDEDNDWLPTRGENRSCSPYVITARKTGISIGGVSQCSLLILRDGQTQNMDIFQTHSRNDDELIKAAEMLLEKEKESSLTSLVISKDGAGSAGMFCVLHNALQQLRMDGEVDIYTIVRQLHTRRPEAINKLEEYRKCYQLVFRSVSMQGIYANM